LISSVAVAAEKTPDYLRAKPDVVEAWQDMRFGMFNCWGPVSLTGEEIGWSRGAPPWGRRSGMRGGKGPTPAAVYDDLYKKWKPDKFDARAWVDVAKDAGMKYMIFLVKHHDGYCLYDSKLTSFKQTGPESAWKVDVMKEVADACHEADLKLIIYYSQPDWHHPDYLGEHHERYIEYLHRQVRELLTNYGKIDGLWFDNLRGRGDNPEAAKLWKAEELFRMARSIQPDLIINDRCGLDADFYTPEQHVGRFQRDRPWESCITLGTQWAWKPDDHLKPYTDGLRMLIVCAIGNGNLALNTGPMPDGRIEPRQVESFRQIGKWMRQYGDSIYGTRGGPFLAPEMNSRKFGSARNRFDLPGGRWWGGSTHKGKTVYLHILRWPSEKIVLPDIGCTVVSHSVLTGGQATVKETAEGIEVFVSADQRDPLDTIVKLEFDGPLCGIEPIRTGPQPLSLAATATASGVWPDPHLAPELAFDGDPGTRWGCAPDTKAGWLAVDLGEPKTFSRLYVNEGTWDRVRKFELQIQIGEDWQAIHTGTTIGENFSVTFEPVTARHVRLNILEASDVPTIWEVQLFEK